MLKTREIVPSNTTLLSQRNERGKYIKYGEEGGGGSEKMFVLHKTLFQCLFLLNSSNITDKGGGGGGGGVIGRELPAPPQNPISTKFADTKHCNPV